MNSSISLVAFSLLLFGAPVLCNVCALGASIDILTLDELMAISNCSAVDGALNIDCCTQDQIEKYLHGLEFVSDNLYLGANVQAESVSLPSLTGVGNALCFTDDNPTLLHASFPKMVWLNELIVWSIGLKSIDFPELITVADTLNFDPYSYGTTISSLTAPKMVIGQLYMTAAPVTVLSYPNLKFADGWIELTKMNSLTTLDFPNLEVIWGGLSLTGLTALTNITSIINPNLVIMGNAIFNGLTSLSGYSDLLWLQLLLLNYLNTLNRLRAIPSESRKMPKVDRDTVLRYSTDGMPPGWTVESHARGGTSATKDRIEKVYVGPQGQRIGTRSEALKVAAALASCSAASSSSSSSYAYASASSQRRAETTTRYGRVAGVISPSSSSSSAYGSSSPGSSASAAPTGNGGGSESNPRRAASPGYNSSSGGGVNANSTRSRSPSPGADGGFLYTSGSVASSAAASGATGTTTAAAEEESTAYPKKSSRVGSSYQADVPSVGDWKLSSREEYPANFTLEKMMQQAVYGIPRGVSCELTGIDRWRSDILSDTQIDEYVHKARASTPAHVPFNIEDALTVLHECNYDTSDALFVLQCQHTLYTRSVFPAENNT
ncbi:hypothetical protein Pelo_8616 [Pelomyxa schiedti]|nr:hypothetical protein Pelo_8616 [Pelomyxa schiedti]